MARVRELKPKDLRWRCPLKTFSFKDTSQMDGVGGPIGQERALAKGFHIDSVIGDVHVIPFPDNHFDTVTLTYATRHLRVNEVFKEIHRVLKPGGCFYH